MDLATYFDNELLENLRSTVLDPDRQNDRAVFEEAAPSWRALLAHLTSRHQRAKLRGWGISIPKSRYLWI